MNSSASTVRALSIVIALIGVTTMSLLAHLLNTGVIPMWQISDVSIINLTFTMQMMILPVSFVAVALTRLVDKQNFKTYFRWGISFDTEKNNWATFGPVFAIAFTVGTVMLMSFSVFSQHGAVNEKFFALLPLVLVFSITNAWSEEVFTRLAIVSGLHGRVNPTTICWISAVIFGAPHFFGTPSGIFGMITSGALGWVLCKSVIESKGLGWALLIHFLQDVAIFGAGAMIIAGNS